MKLLANILLSIFFAIAIGVHIYYVIEGDHQPLWWHGIYFVTYGICWWTLFSKNKHSSLIYAIMALFPFITHVYYGYLHIAQLDAEFWVCILTCVLLLLGFVWMKKATAETMAL